MMDILNRNIAAKVIALIVAIILWFFVMNEQNPAIDSSVTVPLEVQNAANGYVVNHTVENVKIKVRGPRSLFAMATERDFKAYVDLKGATEGKHSIKIQTSLPQGFEVVTVSPESAIFDIDKIIQKSVPVEIAFSGSLETGVAIGKAVPAFENVRIEGPSVAVNEVENVVGYLNLSGRDSDFNVAVPVVAVNGEGKEVSDISITPTSVKVDVSLVKGLYKKFVDIKPTVKDDLAANYVLHGVRLNPTQIDIYGDQRIVDTLDVVFTEPISLVDVKKLTKKQIKLQLPIGITVVNDVIDVEIDVSEKSIEKNKE